MSYLGSSVKRFCKMDPNQVRALWNDPVKRKELMEMFDKVAKDAISKGEEIVEKSKETTDKDELELLSIQLMDPKDDTRALKRAWLYLKELGLVEFEK